MLLRLRQNIQTRHLIHLVYLLVLILLFLSTGHELMHNHAPDTEEHEDCPAYQIEFLLNSLLIPAFFFSLIITFFLFFSIPKISEIDSATHREIYPRAPPLFL